MILGNEIKVRRVKTIPKHKHCRGLWVPDKNLIYIVKDSNIDIEWQTLKHEQVHAILDYMGLDDLSADEKFVDLFGSILHQIEKTAEY